MGAVATMFAIGSALSLIRFAAGYVLCREAMRQGRQFEWEIKALSRTFRFKTGKDEDDEPHGD